LASFAPEKHPARRRSFRLIECRRLASFAPEDGRRNGTNGIGQARGSSGRMGSFGAANIVVRAIQRTLWSDVVAIVAIGFVRRGTRYE